MGVFLLVNSQTGVSGPSTCTAMSFHKTVYPRNQLDAKDSLCKLPRVPSPTLDGVCVPPETPTWPLANLTHIDVTTLPHFLDSTAGVQLTLSPLRACTHSAVTLTKTDGAPFTPHEISNLELYLHFYTLQETNGLPCVAETAKGCVLRTRRIILKASRDALILSGVVVPDSSSLSYVVEIRVRDRASNQLRNKPW